MLQKTLLGCARNMGLDMTDEQADKFAKYHELLIEANRHFNLTRISAELQESVDRNYLDSIAVLAHDFPCAKNIIDVGTGAGFPGVPMAIMLPDTHFTLLDSLGKRVHFLQSVITALQLNAVAVQLRAEDAAKLKEYREHFDMAVARAVAPLNTLSEYMLPFLRIGGYMLSLKGPTIEKELNDANNAINILGGTTERIISLPIANRDWQHCAVLIKKVAPTPPEYPRQAGTAKKRPLTNR